jgi:hypothetical protein
MASLTIGNEVPSQIAERPPTATSPTTIGEHATAEFLDDEPVVEARTTTTSTSTTSITRPTDSEGKMARTVSSAVIPSSSSSSSTRIQRRWARKHKRSQRYAHEHNKDPGWSCSHSFVVTNWLKVQMTTTLSYHRLVSSFEACVCIFMVRSTDLHTGMLSQNTHVVGSHHCV